jgi:hypothetical protein
MMALVALGLTIVGFVPRIKHGWRQPGETIEWSSA